MSKLLDDLLSAGSVKTASTLDESPFFNERDVIPTDLPILNVAFSGRLDGGLTPGLTVVAGESKSFKTLLSLYCIKAYFKKYPDAVCIFYDSEFGTTPNYLKSMGINTQRVIHIPVEHVEQLKFDMAKRLDKVSRGDKVFFLIDSLGNLASKKEVEDAIEEKSVADMSRAKAIRSLFRIITPHLTMKDIPCMVINHVYKTMEMYSKTIIPGGTAVTYTANQIFIITKAQEKDKEGELAGYRFTINIEKSRFVKEKSKLPFIVTHDKGIDTNSSLFDLALQGGIIKEVSKGWYSTNGTNKIRKSEIENNDEYMQSLLHDKAFKDFIEKEFTLNLQSKELEDE